ncbi:Virion core protein [Orf virus]|uniref:25 kDa core protein OPG138 n=1 Tax=Orf virus TaxID=10258 RepID=A0A7U0YEP6_ORFV|nr:Virion core protein [Orf virus]
MASEKMAQRPQSSYDDYVNTLQKIAPHLRSLLTQLNNEQVIRGGAASGDVDCVGGAGALEASSSSTRRGSSSSSSSRKRTTGTRSTGSRSTGSRSSGPRSSSSTRSRRSGAPSRRNNDGAYSGMNACDDETTIQAVSNCGKIVYGVVKNGKLDVQGTVGEVCEDLLGIDSVNGGRKKSSSGRSGTGTSTSRRGGTGTGRSSTSSTGRRSTNSGTSSSASSSRRRASSGNTPCSTTSSASTGARRRASNLMNAMDLDSGMC